ncbi:MAG: hypothetical protein MUQ00_11880, partial [Candidatus Aminicenantes bacterium]|nr:hypothetical protein [Candidatus Aminicenantes bacterium]
EEERLPYVIIVSGSTIRLHPVRHSVGVGRRGRTETFLELNLDLLEEKGNGDFGLGGTQNRSETGESFYRETQRFQESPAALGEDRLRSSAGHLPLSAGLHSLFKLVGREQTFVAESKDSCLHLRKRPLEQAESRVPVGCVQCAFTDPFGAGRIEIE